ncbi:MAG: biotin synthase BioB [Firmicutes bacterium]|nr:biotin synthase BioB [Bacillota bacterium]
MKNINKILELSQKIIQGKDINKGEADYLSRLKKENINFLLIMAGIICKKFKGRQVDLCSVVNARSSRCSEDCSFCAQSIYHQTDINTHQLLSKKEILKAAYQAEAAGADRFSLVTTGRGIDGDFENIISIITEVKKKTNLKLCVSLGLLNKEAALKLKENGVERYHHNLETAPSYFEKTCTTHSYQERIETIHIAQEAGLEVCSGGILGLGESREQRLEMAFLLKELRVDSVPLNILNPISGTPLADKESLPPLDILQTIAVYRFILPETDIRYAGGREANLRDLQALGLIGGINGMLTGDYLTTSGRKTAEDIVMINDLGLARIK